jgi:hypothetical protein
LVFKDIEHVLKLISKLPLHFDTYLFNHLLLSLFLDFFGIHDFFELFLDFSDDVSAVGNDLALEVTPELSDLRLIVTEEVPLLHKLVIFAAADVVQGPHDSFLFGEGRALKRIQFRVEFGEFVRETIHYFFSQTLNEVILVVQGSCL